MIDEKTLDDYFKGNELTEEELAAVMLHRKKCIVRSALAKSTSTFLETMFFQEFYKAYQEKIKLFQEKIKEKKVIELGPGDNPMHDLFLELGATEYVAVEPFNTEETRAEIGNTENCTVVKQDALSYLLEQPDESAIVVSSGLMCKELWYQKNNDYLRFLGREIFRVTPDNSMTAHSLNGTSFEPDAFFGDHGFRTMSGKESWSQIWIKSKEHTLDTALQEMDEFYSTLADNRNAHYKQERRKDNPNLRNPCMRFLMENMPDDSVVLDLFSGDGIVPLGVGYLQKRLGKNKITKIYAVDDNSDDCGSLVAENHESLGVDFELQYSKGVAGFGEARFKDKFPDVNAVTLIDSLGYLTKLWGNLPEGLEHLFNELEGIKDIYICQVNKHGNDLSKEFKENIPERYEVVNSKVYHAGARNVDCWHLRTKQ